MASDFLDQLYARADASEFPPVRAITRGPKHHWFSYYDKWQFDPSDRFALGMQVDFEHRSPTPARRPLAQRSRRSRHSTPIVRQVPRPIEDLAVRCSPFVIHHVRSHLVTAVPPARVTGAWRRWSLSKRNAATVPISPEGKRRIHRPPGQAGLTDGPYVGTSFAGSRPHSKDARSYRRWV